MSLHIARGPSSTRPTPTAPSTCWRRRSCSPPSACCTDKRARSTSPTWRVAWPDRRTPGAGRGAVDAVPDRIRHQGRPVSTLASGCPVAVAHTTRSRSARCWRGLLTKVGVYAMTCVFTLLLDPGAHVYRVLLGTLRHHHGGGPIGALAQRDFGRGVTVQPGRAHRVHDSWPGADPGGAGRLNSCTCCTMLVISTLFLERALRATPHDRPQRTRGLYRSQPAVACPAPSRCSLAGIPPSDSSPRSVVGPMLGAGQTPWRRWRSA